MLFPMFYAATRPFVSLYILIFGGSAVAVVGGLVATAETLLNATNLIIGTLITTGGGVAIGVYGLRIKFEEMKRNNNARRITELEASIKQKDADSAARVIELEARIKQRDIDAFGEVARVKRIADDQIDDLKDLITAKDATIDRQNAQIKSQIHALGEGLLKNETKVAVNEEKVAIIEKKLDQQLGSASGIIAVFSKPIPPGDDPVT